MTPEPPIGSIDGLADVPRPAYDVCNPDRLPADRVAFVDRIHQEFLQSFGAALASYLDTPVEATPAGMDQVPFSSFLEGSSGDACLIRLDLAPMRGQAWVGLTAKFVFRILDILMGAPQTAAPTERTTITEIEKHVLREFFQSLTEALDRSWRPSGISLRVASVGIAEDARKTVDPEGVALVLKGNVKIAESEESFRVAFPVLAVRLAALQSEQQADAQMSGATAERAARLEAIGAAAVQMEAILAGSAIRLGDLAAMQPGQVLVLTQPAGSQLECLVNGKPKFRGEWIALGDRHGLQVDALVEAAESN